jgi:hypothetical protein
MIARQHRQRRTWITRCSNSRRESNGVQGVTPHWLAEELIVCQLGDRSKNIAQTGTRRADKLLG